MKVDTAYPNATAAFGNDQAKVRNNLRQIEPPEVQQSATARVSPTAGAARTAGVSDTAKISGVTPPISALAAAVYSAPDVRQARVEVLRDAVEQGTYRIEPQRIAESMLAQATSKLR